MTAPIKANTMRTNEAKEMLSARVSRVVKALIRAERRDGESDGEFIERLVLDNIETQEGRRIVTEYAGTNPLTRAVLALPKRLLAAVAWLSLDARPAGRLVSSHSTLRRARREVVERSSVPWSPDVLRHTYGSMRIASGDSPERVAADMGNSPRILLTHYRELVTREEAEKFWSLFPPTA